MGELLDLIVFFGAIILVPYYVAILLFQIFCIVWAPYASSTCAGIARRRGLDANRYGRVGFVYSVLLFVPWLHLNRRMQGRPFSFGTDSFDYTFLYLLCLDLLWLGVIAANAIILLMTVGLEGWGMFQVALILAAAALGMPAWILSLRALLRRRSVEDEKPENMQAEGLPERVYIMPFVWTSANILALPSLLILGVIIGLLLSPFF